MKNKTIGEKAIKKALKKLKNKLLYRHIKINNLKLKEHVNVNNKTEEGMISSIYMSEKGVIAILEYSDSDKRTTKCGHINLHKVKKKDIEVI